MARYDDDESESDAPASAHARFKKCATEYGGMHEDDVGPGNPPIPKNRTTQGPNFIKGAIKRPGALHRALGVPLGQKIPAGKIATAAAAPGRLGQQARFAQTLGKLRK